jgi:hypothetical protein
MATSTAAAPVLAQPTIPSKPVVAANTNNQQPQQQPSQPIVTSKEVSATSVNELTAELSSLSTKVEPIKEKEEEWDDKNNDEGAVGGIVDEEMGDEMAEVAPKPKKTIVIREYKPKKEPINVIFCGHVDAGNFSYYKNTHDTNH